MQITRLAEAKRYDAPKHFDMRSLRLQGLEASAADFAWVGLSYFLPGSGAEMDAGAAGKIYVVLDGEPASGDSPLLARLRRFLPSKPPMANRLFSRGSILDLRINRHIKIYLSIS